MMPSVHEERFPVVARSGERLACSFFAPSVEGPWPAAVLFHGFASRRMNATNTALAPRLVARGFAVVVADLSGHGQSTGDLAAHTVFTAPREVSDVVNHVVSDGRIDARRVAVLGNSFSGGASILAMPEMPVVALGLKAPACDYEHIRRQELGEAGMRRWEQERTILVTPGIKVDFSSVEAARSVNVFDAFANIRVPVRVWQGTADEIIPAEDWQRLESLCDGEHKRFVRFEGADHGISSPHFENFIAGVDTFFVDVLS